MITKKEILERFKAGEDVSKLYDEYEKNLGIKKDETELIIAKDNPTKNEHLTGYFNNLYNKGYDDRPLQRIIDEYNGFTSKEFILDTPPPTKKLKKH